MKKSILTLAASLFVAGAFAQSPLWMRHSAISPDGTLIAFTYKGDVYTVPTQGGRAQQITTHEAYDTNPVWSPDSKQIAFASAREGSMDIYLVNRDGGIPKRLTTHTNNEVPIVFKDKTHILFATSQPVDAKSTIFPGRMSQVFQVSTEGGRPELFAGITMEDISVSKDGKRVLYHDVKGYEDAWRKHHTSSVTRDIWMYDIASKAYTQITKASVEDRNPVWSADGNSFYYLSEKSGSFNVHKCDLSGKNDVQLTKLTKKSRSFPLDGRQWYAMFRL